MARVAIGSAAFAQQVFQSHPIDRFGRCTRPRCRRSLGLNKRRCPLRSLIYYLTADDAVLWFQLLHEMYGENISLTATRKWLATSAVGEVEDASVGDTPG